MSAPRVRRLGAGDEARLVEIARDFKASSIDAAYAARFLADPDHIVLVVERDDRVAGLQHRVRQEARERQRFRLGIGLVTARGAH